MRTLEGLLLLADLLALCVLSVPRTRTMHWARNLTAIALVMAAAQALVDGPRWQMAPAYALAASFFLIWLLQRLAPTRSAARPTRLRRMGVVAARGLGGLALAIAATLPMLVPVFRFPQPVGPYGIGSLTYHWVDMSRSEIFAADPKERRQLMAQIWYPALANPAAPHAAYMPDADAVMAAFARIHDKPAFIFGHFKYITSNAMPSAPVAADQPRFPVLLFLEGATGFRQMNTFQVEHLVSHGYIVIAMDQPGTAAAVVFPDGHQVVGLTVVQLRAAVGPSYMPGGTDSSYKGLLLPNGRVLDESSIIQYLAQDANFMLDQLGALNQADPNRILTGKLDLQRVGAFGVSLGGIVVGETCRLDARLRACLMTDAPMSAGVVKAGLRQPSMWVTRDAASMRLERLRAGGWSEIEIEAHQSTMRAAYEGLLGAGYFVRVPATFHSNFTDIASWTPLAPLLGLTGPIGERLAHDIINANE